jgi:hypothetical protein
MARGLWAALVALAERVRGDDPGRGDVPGRVMITVMTAALVLAILISVCVTVTVRIPLLPDFIDANTATGQFVVERDRYVDG